MTSPCLESDPLALTVNEAVKCAHDGQVAEGNGALLAGLRRVDGMAMDEPPCYSSSM